MVSPLIRTVLPILVAASFAFAQAPSTGTPQKGDTLSPRHDSTVRVPPKRAPKVKQPKTAAHAADLKPQSTCPVLGSPIDKNLYVDYQGKRIYVCCAGCIDQVKKDPAKYIEKLRKSGQSVEIIDSSKVKHVSPSPDNGSDAKGSGMGSMKM